MSKRDSAISRKMAFRGIAVGMTPLIFEELMVSLGATAERSVLAAIARNAERSIIKPTRTPARPRNGPQRSA